MHSNLNVDELAKAWHRQCSAPSGYDGGTVGDLYRDVFDAPPHYALQSTVNLMMIDGWTVVIGDAVRISATPARHM